MKLLGKKDIGDLGEKLAARYLKKQGLRIIGRQVKCGRNELDIIAKNKEYIVFAEVKTLTFDDPAAAERRPSIAVDMGKRKRTVTAAGAYLAAHPQKRCPRLDVVEVYLDRNTLKAYKINHIPAAFSADGKAR